VNGSFIILAIFLFFIHTLYVILLLQNVRVEFFGSSDFLHSSICKPIAPLHSVGGVRKPPCWEAVGDVNMTIAVTQISITLKDFFIFQLKFQYRFLSIKHYNTRLIGCRSKEKNWNSRKESSSKFHYEKVLIFCDLVDNYPIFSWFPVPLIVLKLRCIYVIRINTITIITLPSSNNNLCIPVIF